jgi:hypothetical protein
MCDLICPQCRMPNAIDCREPECPGVAGFVPKTWQRPLHQLTQDVERYEALLLACHEQKADYLRRLELEVQLIRLKQKKEGRS